jgi:RNA polymerase sigma factor (sigma-70 family)
MPGRCYIVNDLAAMEDWQLLNEYAVRGSEAAFRSLVDRYAPMVYHAALRQVGNPDAAQEATQAVFIALAQKAGRLSRRTVLYGWLFRAARFAVLNQRRDEACRRHYEEQAATMQANTPSDEAAPVWEQLSPHLDDALERLPKADRELVMVRFFGNKSHKEVAHVFRISEDAAKKRLSRALERLRAIFMRRGVAVSSVALLAAFSACGAQAAPAGLTASVGAAALAQGAAGATASVSLAHAVLKLMAWAKAKTAAVIGAGAVLVAAGTATVALTAASPAADNLIGALQRQSGKTVVWDKHLALPASLDLKGQPLEAALDKLAVEARGYWTIDYAVYSSDQALRRLLDLLHEGTDLEGGGWTNLSSRPLQADISIQSFDPHGRSRGFIRRPKNHSRDRVGMTVMLGLEANASLPPGKGKMSFSSVGYGDVPPEAGPFGSLRTDITRAMSEGVRDGVLAPERLLAEGRLVGKMQAVTPVPATAESAARLAKAAQARWTTIYTLRKSPVATAGIKLIHTGMEDMYGPPNLPSTPDAMMAGVQSNRFNLSPEDRAAHERAVAAFKQRK